MSFITSRNRIHLLYPSNKVLRTCSLVFFSCVLMAWLFYALLGHPLIAALYKSNLTWIIGKFMQGRDSTPLDSYYRYADEVMALDTVWLLTLYLVLMLLIRKPKEVILSGCSFVLFSFLLFCFFELFPSLIKPVHLDVASPYFAYKANYIYDEELAWRERPFNHTNAVYFKRYSYSPVYGIDVPSGSVDWITDENGFRNGRTTDSSDIVVLGDSYIEYGDNEADTFVKRLEKKLSGLTVTNLGKSGYGPIQYLEVLKRFGLKYNPKWVLFGFYEGNDIANTHDYLAWKSGKTGHFPSEFFYEISQSSLWQRYWAALKITAAYTRKNVAAANQLVLDRIAQIEGYGQHIHSDLALLELGYGHQHKMLLSLNPLDTLPANEMPVKEPWQAFKTTLVGFRDLCAKNHIVPIVLYIPAPAHIYAEYSTQASGGNWLRMRDSQIAAKTNTEDGVMRLAQELHLDFIDLTPAFEHAAKQGMLLYYPLDAHWNSDGREIASNLVTDILKSKFLIASNQPEK